MTVRQFTTLLFALSMGLAGFLLFQVQPVMAKYILPWFGGSAATWIVSMLFFQVALLVGYAYAYAVTKPLPVRWQIGAQGRAGDLIRYYELNPAVADPANRHFSFVRDAAFWQVPAVKAALSPWRDRSDSKLLWTDASSNLMSILPW